MSTRTKSDTKNMRKISLSDLKSMYDSDEFYIFEDKFSKPSTKHEVFHVSSLHFYVQQEFSFIRRIFIDENSTIEVEDSDPEDSNPEEHMKVYVYGNFTLGEKRIFNQLRHITKYFDTEDKCKKAVKENGNALRFIDDIFHTEEICKLAVKQNPLSIMHISVENQT